MNKQIASAESKARTGLLANYRPLPGVFDELLGADGEMRAH